MWFPFLIVFVFGATAIPFGGFGLGNRSRARGFHLPVMRLQQVSVGLVNEVGYPLDIHYQWWDDPMKPTHIRT